MRTIMKKIVVVTTVASMLLGVNMAYGASAKVTGHLSVSAHIVPVLKDKAWAYTTISTPSKDYNNCGSKTTVKLYNSKGEYDSDTYSETGHTWDLPLNAGAYAYKRAANKAISTHKAYSADTNYKWVSTKDLKWNK